MTTTMHRRTRGPRRLALLIGCAMLANDFDAGGGVILPQGSLKDVQVELPPGFYGDPQATPQCPFSVFQTGRCSNLSLVGVNELVTMFGANRLENTIPVYNLVPPKDTVARLGFQILTVSVIVDMRVRSDGRYDVVSNINNISQGMAILSSRMTLWGVPADMNGPGPLSHAYGTYGAPSGAPRKPFVTAPSYCGGDPSVSKIRVRSWEEPTEWLTETLTASSAPTGCDKLSFNPSLELRPETTRAGVPAAYQVELAVPQNASANGLSTALVRDVTVTLPEDVAISPSPVDGLQSCTDEQAAFGSEAEPACPLASKIGTVAIETPVLPAPLTGGIFLGKPKSMNGPSGEMIRIFLIAQAQGVTIKLEGKIATDPVTGRVRATFADNPQLPFSLLKLRFQGGPRAALTNPRTCGTHTTTAEITSWSGHTAVSTSSFAITQNANGAACAPLAFAPRFVAGMANPAAGKSSSFTLTFGREDTDQDLGAVAVRLPDGVMGMVSAAKLCDEAAAAAGTCGEESRIGSVAVAAGPGTNPFQLPGRAYLTGPYKGAPFGLSIVVPALAGPFDLGTVVVRAAVDVDRRTAALRIASDPLPTILQGIPLRLRRVTVTVDKPGFMLNPTSCSERRVEGELRSSQGAVANVASRFQVGGCSALPYRPRLTLTVGARGRTRSGVTTPLSARLTMPRGHAANRSITVKLPKILNARTEPLSDACTLAQFEAGQCTKRVGTAVAVTPVLREPLRGPAYFVRAGGRLPDLMVALRGQGEAAGVVVHLAGRVSIPRDLSLRTAFDTIPDVPIDSFRLDLVAGKNGPIGVTANLCAARARRAKARIGFRAQSGRLLQVRQSLRIAGCGADGATPRR